jgi:hypothetical protein
MSGCLQRIRPGASKGRKRMGYRDDRYNDDMSRIDDHRNKRVGDNKEALYDSSLADDTRDRYEQGALAQVVVERADGLAAVVASVVADVQVA